MKEFLSLPANAVFMAAIMFLAGIFFASAGSNFLIIFIASLIIGLVLIFLKKLPIPQFFLLFIVLVFGAFYYHFYLNLRQANEYIIFNEKVSFSGVVISDPKFSDKAQFFNLKLDKPFSGKVKIITSPIPEWHYGDSLSLEGKIEPREFVYDLSLSIFPKADYVSSHNGFWFKEKLLFLKEASIAQFKRVLPVGSAALLAGLTFGSQSDFSKELKDQMSLSGTTHLVALSGYNIAVLVLVAAGFFSYFFSRRLTFIFTTLTIIFFVMMVGGEPSVVRAAVMGFLALFAKEAGRVYSFRNAVTLTAALMVLFSDPTILAWNLGFQLSFLSLLGIVYLEPAIKKLLKIEDQLRNRSFLNWRENALTTLSAQLAVAPLIIQSFGQISLTALLANILILEFVPLTMALGFILAALSFVFPYFSFLIAWLINILLTFEISVIKLFSVLRLPVGKEGSWSIFIIYYLLILGFIIYFNKPKISHGKKA